jgi:hypothetical protein
MTNLQEIYAIRFSTDLKNRVMAAIAKAAQNVINGLTEAREVIVAKEVSFIENKDNCVLCKDSRKRLISVIPFGVRY